MNGWLMGNIPADFRWLHDDDVLAAVSGGRATLVVALAGAAFLAAFLVARIRRDRGRHGPTIRHLAGDLGISPREQRLLGRVARGAGLRHPGSLLISRGCFDAAVGAYAVRDGRSKRLVAIRATIFD